MGGIVWDLELDIRDQCGPMPVVTICEATRDLPPGTILKVLTSEHCTLSDFRTWAECSGNLILATHRRGREYCFYIRYTGAE